MQANWLTALGEVDRDVTSNWLRPAMPSRKEIQGRITDCETKRMLGT